MIAFSHTVRTENGIHARPAGLLAKRAQGFRCAVTMRKGDAHADCKRLFGLMTLDVQAGETVTLACEGPDERDAAQQLRDYMERNF